MIACQRHYDEKTQRVARPEVERVLRRTEIHTDYGDLISFVLSSCGGVLDPWVIRDIDGFLKGLPVIRDVAPSILGKFRDLDLGATGCGRWRSAMYKLMSSHSGSKSYYAPTDIHKMNKMAKEIVAADACMAAAEKYVEKQNGLNACERSQLYSLYQMRVCAHVAKSPMPGGRTFKSLGAIGWELHKSVQEACNKAGVAPQGGNPWKKEDQDPAPQSAANSSAIAPVMAQSASSLREVLKHFEQKGFSVEDVVMLKDGGKKDEFSSLRASRRLLFRCSSLAARPTSRSTLTISFATTRKNQKICGTLRM